jgi:hypothetical protein
LLISALPLLALAAALYLRAQLRAVLQALPRSNADSVLF